MIQAQMWSHGGVMASLEDSAALVSCPSVLSPSQVLGVPLLENRIPQQMKASAGPALCRTAARRTRLCAHPVAREAPAPHALSSLSFLPFQGRGRGAQTSHTLLLL